MTVETFVQLIGAASLVLVALRVAVSSVAFVAGEITQRHECRRVLQEFSKRLESAHLVDEPKTDVVSGWRGRRRFRVVKRVDETPDLTVCSFYLEPMDRKAVSGFRPGQFLTFEVPDVSGAGKVRRCYSLSDAPQSSGVQTGYRVTIKRLNAPATAPAGTPGGIGSQFFHQLDHNSVVDVLAPAGEFVLDQDSSAPVVLIAGGVGITPLMSMLEWVLEVQPHRQVWLFNGVRNRSEHIMYDHLKRLAGAHQNFQHVTFYSQPSPYCRLGTDYELEGRISVGHLSALLRGGGYKFYICGPQLMMDEIYAGLLQWGVPSGDIACETFGTSHAAPARFEQPSDPNDDVVAHVKFTRSKKHASWNAGAGNLLELAEQSGINARYGCRSGGCGTCEMRVLSGEVTYVRQPMIRPKAGACLACIAKPATDLVLDV